MARFYVVEVKTEPIKRRQPFMIVEKVKTVDGIRDRITAHWFDTLELAEQFIEKVEKEIA